jgi:hypothetical protein
VAGWLLAAALAHRIADARRRLPTALTAGVGLLLVLPAAGTFFLSLGYYLFSGDPTGSGGLPHTDSEFTFGPTLDLVRGLRLPNSVYNLPYAELTVLGFALILTAAIAARPRTTPEPANAQPA